ncbi:MAG TPA: ATP-binding protein [Actinomycetota bacterium]|nr:ATP-binding protein [Actinomycetota bacterium]
MTDLREQTDLSGLASLVDAMPDRYLILAPDLTIVAATDAYLSASMTRREDIVGRPLFEVFPDNPDDPQADGETNLGASLDRVRRLLRPDAMAVQKYDIRRPASEGGQFETRYWSPRNSPVLDEDGRLRYIVHRVEDVTELVRMKEDESARREMTVELEERTAMMQKEIIDRSKELQRANDQLRAANAATGEFLSRMSHELRTPLNAILGFAQLLDRDDLTSDQSDAVQQIMRGGRHLLALINEVLDISRVESGNLALSPEAVAVADVLADTRDFVAPLAAERGITVTATVAEVRDHHVLADRQRLKQILINLAANAVKYNRDHGTVTLGCDTSTPGTIRIDVGDTGPGIPPEKLGRLFTPFDRLGAEELGIEGTGVGLALSERLAVAMGGSISVESEIGRGSTFSLTLSSAEPVDVAETIERRRAPDVGYGPARTVLYVEDNPSNLRLMERIVATRRNVRLITTERGDEAIALVREHRPDLVLLDLNLPGRDGDRILADLRADPGTRDLKVVIVSADATRDQAKRLLEAGASAYLTKPIDMDEVVRVIDAA